MYVLEKLFSFLGVYFIHMWFLEVEFFISLLKKELNHLDLFFTFLGLLSTANYIIHI